jgi:O6-methylguanine-DNA--protein-cysteine methyltransferase
MSHSAVTSHRQQLSVRLPTPWGVCQLDYRAHTQPLLADLRYGYVADELGLLRITLADQSLVKLAIVDASAKADHDEIATRDDAAIHRWYQQHLHSKQIPTLQLQVVGTEFQHQVWQGLLLQQAETFPGLKPTTYLELATKIGMPNSVRAVANALGANRIAVIIPCHQVLRTDGGLGGYRWGIEIKKQLLASVDADWGITEGIAV